MTYFVPAKTKDDQLHVRMKLDVKGDLETLAESRGLTMSGLVNFLVVREIALEKTANPSLFRQSERSANGKMLALHSSKKMPIQKVKEAKRKTG